MKWSRTSNELEISVMKTEVEPHHELHDRKVAKRKLACECTSASSSTEASQWMPWVKTLCFARNTLCEVHFHGTRSSSCFRRPNGAKKCVHLKVKFSILANGNGISRSHSHRGITPGQST